MSASRNCVVVLGLFLTVAAPRLTNASGAPSCGWPKWNQCGPSIRLAVWINGVSPDYRSTVRAAISSWNVHSVAAMYIVGSESDADIVVSTGPVYDDEGRRRWGVTTPVTGATCRQFRKAKVRVDTVQTPSDQIRAVFCHELGHALGLGHRRHGCMHDPPVSSTASQESIRRLEERYRCPASDSGYEGDEADEPPPGCNLDGTVQPGEQCDGTGCGAGMYCTSACTCQPVAPFPEMTFTRTPNGSIYRTAGKSPVYISSCTFYGGAGCPASFWNAPQDFVDALQQVYPIPVDGTLVRRPDGAVFQMRCGRGEYVASCADVGGCAGLVDLDWAAVDRLSTRSNPCDDGNSCTTDACSAGQCAHVFNGKCLEPIISLLIQGDTCGNGTREPDEECDDGNAAAGDGCSPTCETETTSMRGAVVKVVQSTDGQLQVKFRADDPALQLDGASLLAVGANITLHNPATGEAACLPLPGGSDVWRATGAPGNETYRYRDPTYSSGPCRTAVLRAGSIRMSCDTRVWPIDFSLDEPHQGALVVEIAVGERRFCSLFGGRVSLDGVVGATKSVFAASKAPAPVTCPAPPIACL